MRRGGKSMANKILIASDLHGDARCAELLLQRYVEEEAGLCVLLGDLLYHGPRNDLPEGYAPKKVITLLNGLAPALLCVRGNCDTEVDQMVLNFPILSDCAVLFVDGRRWYLTHGHRWSPESPIPMQKGDLLLSGHTHVPTAVRCGEGGNLALNPGSTSIPKNGSVKSYMVYEDRVFTWKSLETGEPYRTLRLD